MYRYDSYEVGERIDHVDGMTIDEAEHRLATRLYQNPARVHFNAHEARAGRFGRCLVYGGHVLSVARALSFNGLGNVLHIAAINGGTHANPVFAGDTVYAWSEVLDKAELAGHPDLGALRLRLVATKDRPVPRFPVPGRRRQVPARGGARFRLLGPRAALSRGTANGRGNHRALGCPRRDHRGRPS